MANHSLIHLPKPTAARLRERAGERPLGEVVEELLDGEAEKANVTIVRHDDGDRIASLTRELREAREALAAADRPSAPAAAPWRGKVERGCGCDGVAEPGPWHRPTCAFRTA